MRKFFQDYLFKLVVANKNVKLVFKIFINFE